MYIIIFQINGFVQSTSKELIQQISFSHILFQHNKQSKQYRFTSNSLYISVSFISKCRQRSPQNITTIFINLNYCKTQQLPFTPFTHDYIIK